MGLANKGYVPGTFPVHLSSSQFIHGRLEDLWIQGVVHPKIAKSIDVDPVGCWGSDGKNIARPLQRFDPGGEGTKGWELGDFFPRKDAVFRSKGGV